MQYEMLLSFLAGKTHIGINVVLQGQNIVTYFKALQPWNNSDFPAHFGTKEEVWTCLNLKDQYFTTFKEERNMAFYITSKFLFGLIKGVGYINSYFEGDF